MRLTVLFSHFLCENLKRSLILNEAVAEITELWKTELTDHLILISVVPGASMMVQSLGHF